MNRNLRLLLIVFFTSLILTDTLYAGINARLSLFVGPVSIERNSKKITPVSEMQLYDGDSFQIGEHANVNILINGTVNLRISGPKNFIINENSINKEIKKSEEISGLIDKLSKSSPLRSKQTLVFAVRGFAPETKLRGAKKTNKNDSLDKDLKYAAEAYEAGDYTKAAELFETIIGKQDISGRVKQNAKFIAAEIYFKKADYFKALTHYLTLDYKSDMLAPENREIILVRLALCSDLTGDVKSKKKYTSDYFSIYANNGAFKDMIKTLAEKE